MKRIFIVGHGSWNSEHGWVQIPENVIMHFYTSIYQGVHNSYCEKIIEGTVDPIKTLYPQQWTENQTLSYDTSLTFRYEEQWLQKRINRLVHTGIRKEDFKFLYVKKLDALVTLKKIFIDHAREFREGEICNIHWACCRVLFKEDQMKYDKNIHKKVQNRDDYVSKPIDNIRIRWNDGGIVEEKLGQEIQQKSLKNSYAQEKVTECSSMIKVEPRIFNTKSKFVD